MPGSGAQPTLQAGNAPVAPLVLHGIVGGGNHLPSGDPHIRLPWNKKKKDPFIFFKLIYNDYFQI